LKNKATGENPFDPIMPLYARLTSLAVRNDGKRSLDFEEKGMTGESLSRELAGGERDLLIPFCIGR
jgi:hypothetical protein